jgi:FAS-associated factor 2
VQDALERAFGSSIEWQSSRDLAGAVALARSRSQLLLVYVHSPFHTDTVEFCANTLYSARVRDALQQFTCWAVSVDTPIGMQAAVYFNVAAFPFVCVVVPHELDSVTRAPRVVKTFDGAVGASAFETAINDCALRFADNLRAVQQQRVAAEEARLLRAEQEAAYAASLQADEARRREERAHAERAAQRQRAVEQFRLLPEPARGDADVLQIAVRLPDRARLVRRFRTTDRVDVLYAFVEANVPRTQAWLDSFSLVTDFPRRHIVNRKATLAQSGIGDMALLHVVTTSTDDDDDDDDQSNQQPQQPQQQQ